MLVLPSGNSLADRQRLCHRVFADDEIIQSWQSFLDHSPLFFKRRQQSHFSARLAHSSRTNIDRVATLYVSVQNATTNGTLIASAGHDLNSGR